MNNEKMYLIPEDICHQHIDREIHLYGLLHHPAFMAGKVKAPEDMKNFRDTPISYGQIVDGKGYRLVRGGIRRHKLKPYRTAAKAEHSAIKAHADFLYQKALHDNPVPAASKPLSRFMLKQQIKRNYAKQIKNVGKAVQNTGSAMKLAAKKAKEVAEKTAASVRRHWKGLLALLGIGLIVMFLLGGLQSCSSMFGGASSSIIASSYLSEDADMLAAEAEDADMLAAEAAYSAMEAELQYELDNFESLHPGYDEYRFDLDELGHDPYVLISILSALHEGVFTIDEVQGDLAMLYILTLTETVEVRYRTETDTWMDDEGNTHMDTYQVAYNYYILNVELENFTFPCSRLHYGGGHFEYVCNVYVHARQPPQPVPHGQLPQCFHAERTDLLRYSGGGFSG